ncbi:sterol desaturase family protein [Labrys sp. KNU-23]|uniref:sterol desaturase family protein n=1 Tax=Labrys sp. KNU-23 TaxID=2789216 RepID=UPI0011EF7CCD|nr:sterol desaturase family protein [Labrys sp. KNU-23]QEN91056.1 sterol desaturase family protein [Labrys sp. KNU-23]
MPIVSDVIVAITDFAMARINILLMMATFVSGGVFAFLFLMTDTGVSRNVRGFLRFFMPASGWFSHSTKIDILLYFVIKFSFRWVALFAAILTTFLAEKAGTALTNWLQFDQKLQAGPISVVILCIIMFMFSDLGEFISHYIQHKNRYLWEFHKIHHSATFLSPLTASRVHPVGVLLDAVFIGICRVIPVTAIVFLYGFSIVELLAMQASASLVFSLLTLGTLQHTHFPISFGILDRVFISPRMHQVHHSVARKHWDKNMGSRLSLWDWIAGTAYLATRDEVQKFGIGTVEDDRGDYQRIWWCFLGPIVNCSVAVRRAIVRTKRLILRSQQAGGD